MTLEKSTCLPIELVPMLGVIDAKDPHAICPIGHRVT